MLKKTPKTSIICRWKRGLLTSVDILNMIGDRVSLIKKKHLIVSTLFCVCNFLLKTCQFIFRCFVCATFWEFYACLRVDFKRRFNAFRAKMWGWFYSTVQRDVTSVRIFNSTSFNGSFFLLFGDAKNLSMTLLPSRHKYWMDYK